MRRTRIATVLALAGALAAVTALACSGMGWVEGWWVDRDRDRVEATFGLAVDCGGEATPCAGVLVWEVTFSDGTAPVRRQGSLAWSATGREVLTLTGSLAIPDDAPVLAVRVVRTTCQP